jgi:putative methionine-R-sulfoxide reductase with GAF domain
VRCHHEKWDGSGYPAGLKGEAIPIGARIIAAVDCFDALASDRPYRPAMSLDKAMAAVELEKHKSFDPAIVDVLQRRYVELEHLARGSRPDPWQLSTNIQIENGEAPGAGFATTAEIKSDPVDRSLQSSGECKGLETLLANASSLQSVLTLQEILAIFAVRLAAVVRFDALALYVPQRGALVPAFVTGQHGPMIESLRIPVGQGLTGWVAQANRTILNGNPAVEPGWRGASSLRSALAIPLQIANGSVGVLTLYSCAENGFTAEGLRLLCHFSGSLAVCIERKGTADNAGILDFDAFRAMGAPAREVDSILLQ